MSSKRHADEETYRITPKGIAALALINMGFVKDMDDLRIDGFWRFFQRGMEAHGYCKHDDDM